MPEEGYKKKGLSRFRISAGERGGRWAGLKEGSTVLVDRHLGLFTVRPFRSRKSYTLALALVAGLVVSQIVKAEQREHMAAVKKRKVVRRRGL